ncbi:hypothetical protein MMC10_010923 [Thelotrema lepadinum]|nr:hypothetical protein [Thelotrema lepadinum]
MPAPPSNRFLDSPSLEPSDPSPPEDFPKVRPKIDKKRRKHEATATVDQKRKEKTSAVPERDELVHLRAVDGCLRVDSLSSSPPESYPQAQRQYNLASNAHTAASPIFAALGDAFREQPATDPYTTPPQAPLYNSPPVAAVPDPPDPLPPSYGALDASPRPTPKTSPANEEIRGGFSNQSPSASPRLIHRLPARRTSGYQTLADPLATSPRGRPVSMPSHFYGIPNPSALNLNQLRGVRDADQSWQTSRSASRKASGEAFVSLDTLDSAGDEATASSDNVLLTSSGNDLHVFKVDKEKTVHLGCIEGLRGTVTSAKVLPCTVKLDKSKSLRPLIAVVVHGPLISTQSRRGSAYSSDSQFDPSHQIQTQQPPNNVQFQTTVEIYSFRTKSHVTTLYASPPADTEPALGRRTFEPPAPIGDLAIHAKGRFIVVSSGVSGEVYVYDTRGSASQPFRCIGKTWTTVPQRKSRTWSSSSASSEADGNREKSPTRRPRPEAALLTISSRWLAYVPPIPPARSTLFGKVNLQKVSPKGTPGLTSHTAPSQPQATCEIDTPFEESRVNRVARDVTQEMLKGARWVGDQGKQAWKSYWTKPPEPSPYEQAPQPVPQHFPPTHAADDQSRVSQQPTLVSILDLEKLAESQDAKAEVALQPIATFPLPGGCSFLSFNPSGLSLLTANAKGDVQYVWDLMQMVHPRSALLSSSKSDSGPVVRQVVRFSRVTVANIIDVVWLGPRGEKLAVVTDRGTVHLHDLPQSALQWPPPPRVAHVPDVKKQRSETVSVQPTSTGWGSAFSAVSGGFSAVRTNPLMGFGNFSLAQASAGAGVRSGKIMATGFSKSVEAATGLGNSLIHMGETRLHIPGPSYTVNPGCVRWTTGKDAAIAITGNGLVHTYRVIFRTQTSKNGKKKAHSVVGERIVELSIPELNKHRKHQDEDLPNDGITVEATWPSLPHASRAPSSGHATSKNPLSFAEIDSCTPFQPFHMDRRVGMYAYTDASYKPGPYDNWVFGEEIPTRLVQEKTITDSEVMSLEEPIVKTIQEPKPNIKPTTKPETEASAMPKVPPLLSPRAEYQIPSQEGESGSSVPSNDSIEAYNPRIIPDLEYTPPNPKKKGKKIKKNPPMDFGEPAHSPPSSYPSVKGISGPPKHNDLMNFDEAIDDQDFWAALEGKSKDKGTEPPPEDAAPEADDPYGEYWEDT